MATLIIDKSNYKEVVIENYSEDIQLFINNISTCSQVHDVKLYESKIKDVIFVILNLEVTLPFRKSAMVVDIKAIEPIAIGIFINEFPYSAPAVFSNRRDFPSTKLPHVTIWWNSIPNICIHRGDLNDWFIEHTPAEYINRIRSWFKDAASGKLIRPGDDFEPMNVNNTTCSLVYSYEKITNFIEDYWAMHSDKEGFAFFSFTSNNNKERSFLGIDEKRDISMEIYKVYHKKEIDKLISEYRINNENQSVKKYYIGILAWGKKSEHFNQYIGSIPNDLNELIALCESLNINIRTPLNVMKNKVKRTEGACTLVLAINRPTKLIGFSKEIELLNFAFYYRKETEFNVQKLVLSNKTFFIRHLEPMTQELAAYISNIELELTKKQILTIGAGALGSKVIYHLARNGFINNTIVDNDKLNPHNLIRHALNADSTGKYKSTELKEKLNQMYYSEPEKNFQANETSFIKFARQNELDKYDVLLDLSASKTVNIFLSNYAAALPTNVFRGELAFEGKLGFLLGEGISRAPNLAQIQVLLYKLAIMNEEVSSWLRNYINLRDEEGEAEFEDIVIGLGCNTSTMKLSDEIISYHSALFANYIKNNIQSLDTNTGKILISYFNEKDYTRNYCKIIEVNKFINVTTASKEWQVKIYEDIYKLINQKLTLESPNETGGILLGRIDIINKIIYVIDTYTPEDSKGSINTFNKGSKGTREYLEHINYRTGGMIVYVGDWHTHPNSSLNMSGTDKTALLSQKSEIENLLWPAHIMIFNNSDCTSYII